MIQENSVKTENGENGNNHFDPLDMHNYRIERLPKRDKTSFEKWLGIIGIPLSIVAFILFAFVLDLPFIQNIDADGIVSERARSEFLRIGAEAFSQSNAYMIGIFLASIILWMTQAIPNYQTSLILIISLVLTGVLPEREDYA